MREKSPMGHVPFLSSSLSSQILALLATTRLFCCPSFVLRSERHYGRNDGGSLCLISFSLFLFFSFSLSFSLSFFLSFSLSLFLSFSLCLFVSLSLCLFVSLSLCLFVSFFSFFLFLSDLQHLKNSKLCCALHTISHHRW